MDTSLSSEEQSIITGAKLVVFIMQFFYILLLTFQSVMIILEKPQPAITATMISRLIEVNVNLGVSQSTTSSITANYSGLGLFGWNFSN